MPIVKINGTTNVAKIGTKELDESDIADGKILSYNSDTGKVEYEDLPVFTEIGKVGSKEVDEDNIADGKILAYKSSTGKVEYEDLPTFTEIGKVGSKEVDEDDIADGKILAYKSSTGKVEYEDLPTFTEIGKIGSKEVDENDIADGKILAYKSSTGKVEYEDLPVFTEIGKIGSKEVDETSIGDGKILEYNSSSSKYVLVDKPEIDEILRQLNNKKYIHTYKTIKTFNNGNAQLLTSTPEYTIKANKLIKFSLRVPARSLTSSRGGLYIQINAKVNGTWYNLGNCGYDGAVMSYDSRDISTYIETKLYDFIGNLGLNSMNSYTLQFEIICRTYSDSVTVNGSHEINQISGNLGVGGPLTGWASDQNYTTIIIEEFERY